MKPSPLLACDCCHQLLPPKFFSPIGKQADYSYRCKDCRSWLRLIASHYYADAGCFSSEKIFTTDQPANYLGDSNHDTGH